MACPWAAARPRAVHAASFARRVGSKPGQAPPPPTGTAAWPSGPSGALHTGDAWRAEVWLGAVPRSPARPRRPRAPQPGPPVTAGALHAGGAWALIGGSIRRPETQLWLSTSNFACNSPEALSNHELTTLELQRFQILLKLLPIELYARFGWRWCRRLPRVSQSGPVGQASRWCETPVAFARAG